MSARCFNQWGGQRMTMRLFSAFLAVIAAFTLTTKAQAAWHEASSDHFVIYADDSEKDIRRFAENLERYHSAMTVLVGRKTNVPSPSNRVTIFVVGSRGEMRELSGSRRVGGFYIPRAGGSRAFVQDIRNQSGYPHFSTVILLHEYAHHFLISSSRFAMPRWLSEGAAEFFSAASFNKDGSVLIGRPARHRAYELASRDFPTAEELLDPALKLKNRGEDDKGFYARSWLLYHYLTFSEERIGQLNQYWQSVASGTSSIDAGREVFGDLRQLEKELDAYQRQRRMFTFNLTPEKLSTGGEITLRRLPKGEAEMMELRIVSQRGVDTEQAAELVVEAREIAAMYPDDPGVLAALAEAEYDAGNDDAAIAAADKAIALDPARTNPYVQKGYALFRKAADADDAAVAFDAAMEPFSQLNKRENDHPLPLIYYYRSYAQRGVEPPENAKMALERAAVLAPFDHGLWLQVAVMQAQEGKLELAKFSLKPLAANPHGGRSAEAAAKFLDALSNLPEGTELNLRSGRSRVEPVLLDDDEDGEGEPADEEASEPTENAR